MTTLLFHSAAKEEWDSFFLLYLCVTFEVNSDSPEEGQTVQRILSAQIYCKYLGPRLSHSFTTVETRQATKKTLKLMWFQKFLVTGSSSETGPSPLLFLPVHPGLNFNVLAPDLIFILLWFLQSCVSLTVPWLFFFFSTQMWLLGFTPQKKKLKLLYKSWLCIYLFQTLWWNEFKCTIFVIWEQSRSGFFLFFFKDVYKNRTKAGEGDTGPPQPVPHLPEYNLNLPSETRTPQRQVLSLVSKNKMVNVKKKIQAYLYVNIYSILDSVQCYCDSLKHG